MPVELNAGMETGASPGAGFAAPAWLEASAPPQGGSCCTQLSAARGGSTSAVTSLVTAGMTFFFSLRLCPRLPTGKGANLAVFYRVMEQVKGSRHCFPGLQ